jgi:hypothetical protein
MGGFLAAEGYGQVGCHGRAKNAAAFALDAAWNIHRHHGNIQRIETRDRFGDRSRQRFRKTGSKQRVHYELGAA